jgi:hypothetical protein
MPTSPKTSKPSSQAIEELQFLLADIEHDQAQQPTILQETRPALRCLDHRKRGAERLRGGVEELRADFEYAKSPKKEWAATKILWKRDRTEKHILNLAAAVRQLSLSYQI